MKPIIYLINGNRFGLKQTRRWYWLSALVPALLLFGCKGGTIQQGKTQNLSSASFRAVCFDNAGNAWISGSQGSLWFSSDLKQWTQIPAPDTSLDYRSLWVQDQTVLLASAGQPAFVFRSSNSGETWHQVYSDTSASAFFDGICAMGKDTLVILGDPRDGRFTIYTSTNQGLSWQMVDLEKSPLAAEGEVAFAASNSSLFSEKGFLLFATGGSSGAFLHAGNPFTGDWKKQTLPLKQGEACGAFNLFRNKNLLLVGGGCYDKPESSEGNFLISENMGGQWFALPNGPKGYISDSGVLQKYLIAVGDTGIQVAPQRTRKFSFLVEGGGWNALACNETHAVVVGKKGAVQVLTWSEN
ncbi:MAG: hypothetical protein ACPF8V_04660 [Luteibaculum sp.]